MNMHTLTTKGRNWGRRFCRCWVKADCSTQAAAISYFAGLSIFPFVLADGESDGPPEGLGSADSDGEDGD